MEDVCTICYMRTAIGGGGEGEVNRVPYQVNLFGYVSVQVKTDHIKFHMLKQPCWFKYPHIMHLSVYEIAKRIYF